MNTSMKFLAVFAALLAFGTPTAGPDWIPAYRWVQQKSVRVVIYPGQTSAATRSLPLAIDGITVIQVTATAPVSVGFMRPSWQHVRDAFPDDYLCEMHHVRTGVQFCDIPELTGPLLVRDERNFGPGPDSVEIRWATLRVNNYRLLGNQQ